MSAEKTKPGVRIPSNQFRRILEAADHLYRSGTFLVPDDPSDPWDEWSMELLALHERNEQLIRLRQELDGLPLEERLNLMALMWLGRGDYPSDDWSSARRAALAARDGHVTEYLATTAQLADLLRIGARKLGDADLH